MLLTMWATPSSSLKEASFVTAMVRTAPKKVRGSLRPIWRIREEQRKEANDDEESHARHGGVRNGDRYRWLTFPFCKWVNGATSTAPTAGP